MKFRSIYYCFIFYPEDSSSMSAFDILTSNYQCAYILHDKDISSTGKIKKPHYHVVCRFKNYRWSSSVSEELGLPLNYMQPCRTLKGALKYLVHFDDPNKYQYSLDCVKGDLKIQLERFLQNSDKDENDKVSNLIEYIYSQERHISISSFASYCVSCGYWDVFRRASTIFIKIIEERNFLLDK